MTDDDFDYEEFSRKLDSPEFLVQRDVAAIYERLGEIDASIKSLHYRPSTAGFRFLLACILGVLLYIAHKLTP